MFDIQIHVHTLYLRPLSVRAQYSNLYPTNSSSRCHGGIDTWTVVQATAIKFRLSLLITKLRIRWHFYWQQNVGKMNSPIPTLRKDKLVMHSSHSLRHLLKPLARMRSPEQSRDVSALATKSGSQHAIGFANIAGSGRVLRILMHSVRWNLVPTVPGIYFGP
jgi:hypothetical protein